jgi:hypothetical protein
MNLPAKLLLAAALPMAALMSANMGAKADDGSVQTRTALICGTAEQVKNFAVHHPDELQAALPAANTEDASGSCLFAQIAFVAGKGMDRIEQKNATYQVTEIMIVGVATPYGIIAVKPNLAYTVLKVKEAAA